MYFFSYNFREKYWREPGKRAGLPKGRFRRRKERRFCRISTKPSLFWLTGTLQRFHLLLIECVSGDGYITSCRGENRNRTLSRERRMNMLELKHVKKSYDNVTILEDINLQIEDGEIISILGPSGCGKTTLLNLVLGLTPADSGQIIFDGKDITNVPMEERGFNIVFQDYALFPNLNVYKNITYGLKNKPDISTKKEVDEFIDLLGLREHLDKKIEQLSGGQKQRVALARTMVMKPKILLLDEPLSALDGVIKESIKEKIKEIARDFHLTTIIVTHDPEEALTLSDKVLIVNKGCISQYGAPQEIITTPQNNFVKEFILNQLEIKKNNIFALFQQSMTTSMQAV
jgi:iron(III) transport system ATP-binding protein